MANTKVLEVQSIEISQEQQSITASGTVNTAGWKDAELVLLPRVEKDMTVEFDFVAQPPDGPVAQVVTPIEAVYKPLPLQGNFVRLIVHASNNDKEVVME